MFEKSERQLKYTCVAKYLKNDQKNGTKTGLHSSLQRESWIRISFENESLPDKKFTVLMTNQLFLDDKRKIFRYRQVPIEALNPLEVKVTQKLHSGIVIEAENGVQTGNYRF